MSNKPSLAQLALSAIKPKKAVAQQILRELAEKHPDSAHELAELYAYFMPPKPKKAKTVWEWVTLAMGTDDVRYYINYVYVTADHLVATDGHRLHVAPNADSLEPGFYLANGDRVHGPDYARYPEWQRVVPTTGDPGWLEAEPPAVEVGGEVACALPGALVEYPYVLRRYLLDAMALDSWPMPVLYGTDAGGGVRFDFDDGRQAVIMPMRG